MFCECGCGEVTKISKKTDRTYGYVKGEHRRFIAGHNNRKHGHGWVEVDRGFATPCHIWQGAKNGDGYGCRRRDQKTVRVHIETWTSENGPVPDGLELDHLCRQRDCVRPSHLEPVTHGENLRRSWLTRRQNALTALESGLSV